ncbi:PREDICTED: olfactory receptor 1G1-like [Nanorana parkeri]|uniref:olfactory receptor 1G1-like n=1 Tax=Nanorana parkeri TaxID=125878 RepID=UPI0008545A53|nr:PREDICTED: olfactory receptor 1G1-like [Nanorana parkeri]
MKNLTKITALILVGLSNHPPTMNGLFVLFLLTYLITVTVNLLIIVLVLSDYHLHNPMYFFLANLALIDVSFMSVTAPKMLFNLVSKSQSISLSACIAQVYFFLFFGSSEAYLLSAMSYDRYVAICHPLHYTQMMSWRISAHMAAAVWVISCLYSLMHTLLLLRLSFCGPNIIYNFFCDLPNLFHIACIDPFINMLVEFIVGGGYGLGAFVCTLLPYVRIFITINKMGNKTGKVKAFSTCTSHLAVVFIFYVSIIVIYMVPTSSNMLIINKLLSVTSTLINPLLNPLIYSLRNKDLHAAFLRTFNCQKINQE